jgi:homoserine O-acetyltransferase/O-succinyltransferase
MSDSENSSEQGDLQDQKIGKDYKSDLGVTHTHTVRLAGLRTQSGHQFEHVDVSYQTLGTLSHERDNAILICHALSGDAHVAGINPNSGKPGWWDYHVGPGKTIDTNKFFVISSNVLGGCSGTTGPLSINPKTGKAYGMAFPPVTIRDMVAAQARLIDHLGISRLFATIGGSMGGMQGLVWAVDYPNRVHCCVPIATSMAHSAMQIAFNEVGRQAIITDPNWRSGAYDARSRPEHGLAVARMVGHVTYLSEFSMREKFGRALQDEAKSKRSYRVLFPEFFKVESYLHYQGDSFVGRFDPNSYLYITKALDTFDLLEGRPPAEVFKHIKAHFLVLSFESDWLYPPDQSRALVKALKRSNAVVTYLNLDTRYGHDSFLIENPGFSKAVHNFFESEYRRQRSALKKATQAIRI